MRLGLVIYGSLETLSGGYLYDRKLVDYLQRHGDTVEIISLPWRGDLAHLSDNLSGALLERLAEPRCDALLQDELNYPSLFYLNRRLHRRSRTPLISIVHHLRASEARPGWSSRWMNQVERMYLESVDAFIFNGEVTRRSVYRHAPAAERRPYAIARPAGDRFGAYGAPLDEAHIRARAQQPGPLRVIFVGNLIERKGLHTLLNAVGRLPAECCRIEVVGDPQVDPGYARLIAEQIERFQLADRVTLCGRLGEAPLAERLRQAHVLAVPSEYEGYGIVYLEGMSFGLPAIAGADGGAQEVVESGRSGHLVRAGDAAALAAHLLRLAERRDLLIEMSLAARQAFLRHPTWQDAGAAARKFLQEQTRR